jgi:hypothetical protein
VSGFRLWTWRIVGALLGLVLLVLVAGFVYEQVGRTHEATHLPRRIGHAIDVGGRTVKPLLLRRGDAHGHPRSGR